MSAEPLSPEELKDVVCFDDEDEPEEQLGVLAFVAGNFQAEESGCIAEAINAHHQAPLNFRGALEEALAIAIHSAARGQNQEGIDRNEDDEEVEPIQREQVILHGNHDEEREEEAAVIGEAGRRERNEFAESPEGTEGEENVGGGLAEPGGNEKDD